MNICLSLCPYRNLTTLLYSVLALHPHVQVMNHGMVRLDDAGYLDFMRLPTPGNFEHLIRGLLEFSAGGTRGAHGGSITFSHAFDHEAMRRAYSTIHGSSLVRTQVDVVAWKESGRLREKLREMDVDPIDLVDSYRALRFVHPIRNPLDHAISLSNFYKSYGDSDFLIEKVADFEQETMLEYVLRSHAEFFEWQQSRPDRFLMFSEKELGTGVLGRIAEFLEIEPDPGWLAESEPCFISNIHYDAPIKLKTHFADVLDAMDTTSEFKAHMWEQVDLDH